ncbi:hypothetical protein BLD49_17315 [Erwinia sp. OLMDSP33]|nr:hypothetical protein BLD49_17315 [Erwinia sp. OLMDSP33]PIJ88285.1 hypothetical protein BL249_18065 [Erwinia sp. OLFS4]
MELASHLELAAYASGPLTPWRGTYPSLYAIAAASGGGGTEVPKPNAIIVSGLNCNLLGSVDTVQTPSGGGANQPTASLGDVPIVSPSGTIAARGTVSAQVQCGGTNTSLGASTVGIAIQPGAGTTVSSGYRLQASNQSGYYGTFNEGASGSCASGLTIGTGWSTELHTYAANEAGNNTPYAKTISFSLCGTGQPQAPGPYSMGFTLQLVNR